MNVSMNVGHCQYEGNVNCLHTDKRGLMTCLFHTVFLKYMIRSDTKVMGTCFVSADSR